MLTFPGDQPLKDLARHCQESLAPLGLDPVPLDALHITLAGIGSPDTVTSDQLDSLAQESEPLLPSAFSLRATPLTGSRGAVRLSLPPWTPLLRLHHALSEAGATIALPPKKPTSAFRPHLSLAYNNHPTPRRPRRPRGLASPHPPARRTPRIDRAVGGTAPGGAYVPLGRTEGHAARLTVSRAVCHAACRCLAMGGPVAAHAISPEWKTSGLFAGCASAECGIPYFPGVISL
ncbi:2'-5' RNA ligase family protein [Streptomyces sp. NPDC091385]|uniref:2'-5' RNA ligase family protein n=1 Tax=Streptomyces sp. NPDC091385 TaxID=3365997 RepID=UPI0037F365D2